MKILEQRGRPPNFAITYGKANKQTGFTGAGVSDKHEFEEVVVQVLLHYIEYPELFI